MRLILSGLLVLVFWGLLMGYQIGVVCYATKKQADDAYFSAIVPVIGADGSLYQPVYTSAGWQYQGRVVSAYLPQCDPAANFADGMMIGWGVFAIAAGLWGIRLVKERLRL